MEPTKSKTRPSTAAPFDVPAVDAEVLNIFKKYQVVCHMRDSDDFFFHVYSRPDLEKELEALQVKTDVGYKLHVNVSDECIPQFLDEAIKLLSEKGADFKVMRPSMRDRASEGQQCKLLTIFTRSKFRAETIASDLERILEPPTCKYEYHSGTIPSNEIKYNDYITYRYCNFKDSILHNPWNPYERIDGLESRLGAKFADWTEPLGETHIVSRSDVLNGAAKLGDIVMILRRHVPVRFSNCTFLKAELLDYNAHRDLQNQIDQNQTANIKTKHPQTVNLLVVVDGLDYFWTNVPVDYLMARVPKGITSDITLEN